MKKILFGSFTVLFIVAGFISVQAFGNASGDLTVAFLDVGQGDAIYIESPTGVQMLIDGGKGKAVLRELGAVMPLGDRTIDFVVATHPDQDHIGGLPFVLENYEVNTVIRSGFIGETATFEAFSEAILNEGAEEVNGVANVIRHFVPAMGETAVRRDCQLQFRLGTFHLAGGCSLLCHEMGNGRSHAGIGSRTSPGHGGGAFESRRH